MIATKAIALVRGEFLADLRYETWASRLQTSVHNEVRARLLPIALQTEAAVSRSSRDGCSGRTGRIDPFDEAATLALADCLARSGQRVAARNLLVRYADQVQSELNEEPSSDSWLEQGERAAVPVKPDWTDPQRSALIA